MRNILSTSRQVLIYFFIILFVYAAVSKLTDFENFQVQVAQSPLLSAFATFIAYTTVIGELIIALMLCFQKSRLLGLYLFLGVMTAFTVYIFLILNYSPFVPCSCGGVLEDLGWWEHLWFNGVVCLVCVLVILTEHPSILNRFSFVAQKKQNASTHKKSYFSAFYTKQNNIIHSLIFYNNVFMNLRFRFASNANNIVAFIRTKTNINARINRHFVLNV